MKPDRPFWKNRNARGLFLLVAFCAGARDENLFANPTGMTVGSGSATAVQNGSQLNVTTSQLALLNWSSFNIQAGETTTFLQPSANSVVFNEIGGASPSQIFGSLNANGTVILANANGFYFGPNSMISVGGSFIATTAPLTPDFGAGSAWTFTGMPPLASIVNYGQVKVGAGKSLYLIAEDVENHGGLSAPGGDVGLYAGQEVQLNERADGRGFSSVVRLPAGSVNNFGQITADAGTIALQAQVVNQNGVIQADSVQNENGVVELVASDTLNLGANSTISVSGDSTATSPSPGGMVVLDAGNSFADTPTTKINVAAQSGGRDGIVEIFGTGVNANNVQSSIDNLTAANVAAQADLFINPYDLTLSQNPTAATVNNGNLDVNFNVNDLANYAQIALFAGDNIELQTAWNLSDPGVPTTLHLQAGNNITFANGSSLLAGNHWNVDLVAGTGFIPTTSQPTPASGSDEIFLDGSSYIQTQDGDINLFASGSVLVGNPDYFNPGIGSYINTAGGGNIYVNAQYGDINAGQNYTGYTIGNNGLKLGQNVGGISTLAGGNVTLDAGNDVISIPQTRTTSATTPGASGAYGAGDVTVIAGNQITGNFLVSNGTGKLEAGVSVDSDNNVTVNNPTADIGTAQQGVNLSLISGNWQVFAARNLYVTEVNNPNGTFNANSIRIPANTFVGNIDGSGNITLPTAKSGNLFNYAPNAGASFWAGNAITLGNGKLFRFSQDSDTTAIFPPILSLMAGVGGIALDSSIILYPSSQGSLNVEDGGNFTGVINNTVPTGITMSDSGLPGFATFATGHAVTPLHSVDPNPVVFDVAGSLANLSLVVPTFADITVGGTQPFTAPNGQNIYGTYNFNFHGQNLASSGVGSTTSINVMGNIIYQGLVTSIILNNYNAAPLPAEMFETAISTDPSVTQYLAYDPATGLLSYRGQMNSQGLAFLQNPTVVVNGQAESISLTTPQKSALAALFAQSQGAQASGSGISLNGPGRFNLTAQNMDLGTSAGIQVNQQFLPELFSPTVIDGASLNVNVSGNLEMTTTAIGNSGWQGGIQMNIGGTLDLGLQSLFGEPNNVARGIFTASDGNISVTAGGDIDVDGSRIAAYDGGNITVISQQGDVNAGSGGAGNVEIQTELQLNADGTVTTLAIGRNISGSGILALTDAASTIGVGNITVTALQGSINADLGGIEQIPFNNISKPGSFISLDAGKDISAGNSGVIGSNIRVTAGGSISGLFVGSGSVGVNAGANFSGTIVGSTSVTVAAGGSVSGTIVGGDSVSVSGGDITASLDTSGSVSTSGDASGATVGIPQSNVAQNNAQTADNADAATSKTSSQDDADELKKKKPISLAQKVSRVTVILPPKIFSENQGSKNPL
jgi:filamentous hemagglutinin family protein